MRARRIGSVGIGLTERGQVASEGRPPESAPRLQVALTAACAAAGDDTPSAAISRASCSRLAGMSTRPRSARSARSASDLEHDPKS